MQASSRGFVLRSCRICMCAMMTLTQSRGFGWERRRGVLWAVPAEREPVFQSADRRPLSVLA